MKENNHYQQKLNAIPFWAEDDRPREKLELKGKNALSDAELIAILIASGNKDSSAVDLARMLLNLVDHDLSKLAKLGVRDLTEIRGIGKAKAITIISAFELARRKNQSPATEKNKITCSSDVYNLMKPNLQDQSIENFWIVLLDRANQVIKKHQISQGGISGTVADPKVIFKIALENLSSGLILVHNHPSGNLKPSQADIKLTARIKNSGDTLEIQVLDHLIYTDQGYYSFADEGML